MSERTHSRSRRKRLRVRDAVLVGTGALVALLLAGRLLIPGDFGVFLDSGLPWVGLLILPAAVGALLLRSRAGAAAVGAASLVWALLFVPAYVPGLGAGGGADTGSGRLTVATLNVGADNPDPCGALREVSGWGADVVAVEELAGPVECASAALGADGTWIRQGTVGLWSRHPVDGTAPLEVAMGMSRGLRATVHAPGGDVAVLVGHVASLRPRAVGERNGSLQALASDADAEGAGPVVVAGDMNTAATDRAMEAFDGFGEAQRTAGWGPGFTWPASAPMVRLDHVLYRDMRARSAAVHDVPGSDHRGVVAELAY
ncbi:endonuclease/exonuclease/phosphatase family protein [Nocardiopsis sp. RSe5-2]|uniref:Endonuclease/exonuclease/phosphatase family protein n=1 Tax=Nocardiopsis endophytica TaxID=3018445 RepID=A0ABT4U612_9ACTN|nr:endonuclease/exonuclease/phosphatase family protein [Nocardiopsis endophytica]MDA2812384.1 endonuclease/exonuclease/phosphatase family protein [Nocardiopsis endophytica]